MGYAELFDYHVMPIARAQRLADGAYSRPQWVGTGFTFGEGTLVTCWHCVGADLAEDEVYFGLGREHGNQQRPRDWPIELRQLAQDMNGADLGLARIDVQFRPRLRLASVVVKSNETVGAYWTGCGWSVGWLIQATSGNTGGRGREANRSGCAA